MKTMMRSVAGFILAAAVTVGCGWAQDAAPEKHVKDIMAEQPPAVILASPLCQRTRENPLSGRHYHVVDKSTLEPDLDSLIDKSEEVILGTQIVSTQAISPSGEDAIAYIDVRVLRSWKGSHKVGDIITFAMPTGMVRCTASIGSDGLTFVSYVDGWGGSVPAGPYVLMLRHSQGDETQLIPGFRLTGGEGMQGLFSVYSHRPGIVSCNNFLSGGEEKCIEFVKASQTPVIVPYPHDPLFKKYSKMPISSFMQEFESVANSLGYAPLGDISAPATNAR